MPSKLHIGAGTAILEGWVNIDILPGPAVDVVHDVLQLSGGIHTVSLWCAEDDPDNKDFVVSDLRMAVVELGLD